MPLKLTTYYHGKDIPDNLPGTDTFHSKELFLVYEATPGYIPLLIVATDNGRPMARMLAVSRKAKRWLPAILSRQCMVYGSGEMLDASLLGVEHKLQAEAVFEQILEQLTREALRTCVFIEFRNLAVPMFGYRPFRANGYFPVNWLRVRNSLHGALAVEERFSPSRSRQIKKGLQSGAVVREAVTSDEVRGFARMLRGAYSTRVRRHFPSGEFFRQLHTRLAPEGHSKIFIVVHKERVIGGAACLYSDREAYLWFSGGMRKTYALQYPGVLAVWKALDDAYHHGYEHLEFMDVGLPFRKHGYREFVLRFGGKQSSTRRWFKVRWAWLNKLLEKFYV
ncbi:MAG: GNAT family N-acetyltransferase [Mediterranea sp.]|nr:GNAT family N-acetyltransferase [Mediterranea sp.]